jgi:hypothetical protein
VCGGQAASGRGFVKTWAYRKKCRRGGQSNRGRRHTRNSRAQRCIQNAQRALRRGGGEQEMAGMWRCWVIQRQVDTDSFFTCQLSTSSLPHPLGRAPSPLWPSCLVSNQPVRGGAGVPADRWVGGDGMSREGWCDARLNKVGHSVTNVGPLAGSRYLLSFKAQGRPSRGCHLVWVAGWHDLHG